MTDDPLDIMNYNEEVDEYIQTSTSFNKLTDHLIQENDRLNHYNYIVNRNFGHFDSNISISIKGRNNNGSWIGCSVGLKNNKFFDAAFMEELNRRVKLSLIDDVDRSIRRIKTLARKCIDDPEKEEPSETDEISF